MKVLVTKWFSHWLAGTDAVVIKSQWFSTLVNVVNEGPDDVLSHWLSRNDEVIIKSQWFSTLINVINEFTDNDIIK